MDIKVYKNFMDNLLFINLKENIENSQFAWFKSGIVPEIEDIQLIHTFFEFDKINSEYFKLLSPCIELLGIKKLIRIKANLVVKTSKIHEHGFHIDNDKYKNFDLQYYI